MKNFATRFLQTHGYTTSHRVVTDGDSKRLQTTFLKHYNSSDIDVEDYNLLETLTNDSTSTEDKNRLICDFIAYTEIAIRRQEIKPGNIWSVDLLSPANTSSIRLPAETFVVLFHFYKDCREAFDLCRQLE